MQISLDSEFIVYGAGTRGKEYYKVITRNNMNVLAFIDKNALKIKNINNIPVYELNEFEQLSFSKQEIVVIISISNVFGHYEIAKKLYDMGYQYIVYKELFDNSSYAKKINEIFQIISNPHSEKKLEELELPAFRVKQLLEAEEEKSQFVIKHVPIDLLFGLSKEFYLSTIEKKDPKMLELIPDKSLLYFTINKDMMHYFLHSVTEIEWENYLKLYFKQRRCMIKDDAINLEDEKDHLKDRYNIFQNMEILYNTNIQFFYDNPIEVEWNQKGYFNMQDGNNRAAFLFAKGWNMLPCKMSCDDYKLWLNQEKINEVATYLNQIDSIEYPISNPYFANVLSKSMPFCYLKLRKLCEWLFKSSVKISDKNILDIACRNGFIGQYFARMGANVTAIEDDISYRQLCKLVNELIFTDEEVLSSYEYLHGREFDIVLIPLWASDDLQKILSYAKQILIIDTTMPEKVFSNSVLKENYTGEELCQLFYDSKIVHTIIFTKK